MRLSQKYIFVLVSTSIIVWIVTSFAINVDQINETLVRANTEKYAAFSKISLELDEHIEFHGSWPSPSALEKIGKKHSKVGASMRNVKMLGDYFAPNTGKALGPVPDDSYLLTVFRRNGFHEYYAAWSNSVNFAVKEAEIYPFGIKYFNRIVYPVIAFFFIALFIWRFGYRNR